MGIRRAGRIIVLQSLYQLEIANKSTEEIIDFIENYPVLKLNEEEQNKEFLVKSKDFAIDLVKTVIDNMAAVDAVIPKYLKNWAFDRILSIDRNILRMGVAELLFREDIPYKVTINEAIELAKKFGDDKSGSFVNGVLDNVVKSEASNFETLGRKTSAK